VAWSGTAIGTRFGIRLQPVELLDLSAVSQALEECRADAVIHAAAMSSTEAVYHDPARAEAVNEAATRLLAEWASRNERRLIFTSTALLFDASRSWTREIDPAEPILEYGRSKLRAERAVLNAPRGVIARLSLLFGPAHGASPGFFDRAVLALKR